jgi:hypothetical protein
MASTNFLPFKTNAYFSLSSNEIRIRNSVITDPHPQYPIPDPLFITGF